MPRLPKHPKVRGELAEAQFVPVAIRRGFRVAKPFGDSAPYDFLLEKNGVTARVQVKATARRIAHGWFQLATRRGVRKRFYSAREIDFVVAYLFLEDIWYVIPVREVTGRTIFVRPGSGGKYEKFREAWGLLAWGRRKVPRLARAKAARARSG